MPLLTYTLLRLGFMFAVGVVLYLLGVRSWLLLALSILMGAGLSYVLLARPRQSAAEDLERRTGGRPTRLERAVDADAEDEDAQLAGLSTDVERAPAAAHDARSPGAASPADDEPEGTTDDAPEDNTGDEAGSPDGAERAAEASTPSRAGSADEHRDGEGQPEHDADGQLQHPGAGQHPDQVRAPGTGQDPAAEQRRGQRQR